jgi:hypothetical protein
VTEHPTGETPAADDRELLPREDVVDAWRADGYEADFEVVDGGRIASDATGRTYEPEELQVDRIHRHEGTTDPGDEELLLAVTCPETGVKGTLTLAYGAYASAAEAEVARRIPDARER